MLAHGIAPVSDEAGIFLTLLRELTDRRVTAKRLARDASTALERQHHGALAQSFRILLNAFYGSLAFSTGHWNDFAAADRVTTHGREVVTGIIARLTALGCVSLEADTDGVYFVPPPDHRLDNDDTLLEQIAANLPDGIRLELDGRYVAFFSYKLKTYALLDEQGRVTLKGSGFRSRGLEPFQRRLIAEIVRLLLESRGKEVRAVVDRWLEDFARRRVPARMFARTETLGDTLEAYREKIAAGVRRPAPAYGSEERRVGKEGRARWSPYH